MTATRYLSTVVCPRCHRGHVVDLGRELVVGCSSCGGVLQRRRHGGAFTAVKLPRLRTAEIEVDWDGIDWAELSWVLEHSWAALYGGPLPAGTLTRGNPRGRVMFREMGSRGES